MLKASKKILKKPYFTYFFDGIESSKYGYGRGFLARV
jgi:hypothetical protein